MTERGDEMKHVITTYAILIVFLISIFMCVNMSNAALSETEAKEFKAHVVSEIENSNFNPFVIEGCVHQAQDAGYELQVTNCTYDENYNIQTAEVILTYTYQLPLFRVSEVKTTRGIAR